MSVLVCVSSSLCAHPQRPVVLSLAGEDLPWCNQLGPPAACVEWVSLALGRSLESLVLYMSCCA